MVAKGIGTNDRRCRNPLVAGCQFGAPARNLAFEPCAERPLALSLEREHLSLDGQAAGPRQPACPSADRAGLPVLAELSPVAHPRAPAGLPAGVVDKCGRVGIGENIRPIPRAEAVDG